MLGRCAESFLEFRVEGMGFRALSALHASKKLSNHLIYIGNEFEYRVVNIICADTLSRKVSLFMFCSISSGSSFVQRYSRALSRIISTSYVCLP